MNNLPFVPGSISFGIPALETLDPSTVKAILLSLTVFIVIVFIAFGRRYLISSSLQGIWSGFIMGIIAVVAIEGTAAWFAKDFVFGEKSAHLPKNIRIVLDDSKQNINQVLGIETERQKPTAQSVVSDYSVLTTLDSELVRNSVCKPQIDRGAETDQRQ